MTKKLIDTTDQELLLEYHEQLKAENAELREDNKKRRRPIINGDSITPESLVVCLLCMVVAVAAVCFSTLSNHKDKFYVGHQQYEDQVTKQKDSCYIVYKKISGKDLAVTKCIKDKDKAEISASKLNVEWKSERLNGHKQKTK